MNKITLIGNLTKDPELRATPNGTLVCSFIIAVNRRFAPQGQEKQTDYFRVNAWKVLGEACARNLVKGKKVAVFGELQARQYEKDAKTYMSLDVNADEVEFLSPRDQSTPQPDVPQPDADGFTTLTDDKLPF